MSREFKPGDVAVRVRKGVRQRTTAVLCDDEYHPRRLHWHHKDGGWDHLDSGGEVQYHPLVVIDPEDRAQVERLADIFCHVPSSGWVDDMQASLREFANPTPPKPDEPQGLGAVVEDADGQRWLRVGTHGDCNDWRRVRGDLADSAAFDWSDFEPIRVLSEGVVTP